MQAEDALTRRAQTAARVGAKRLALTHMVPPPTPDQYPEWVARAADHFDGEIVIGGRLRATCVPRWSGNFMARQP